MVGRSISAHADAETVSKLRGIAAREGRTPSQLTAASLKLYLDLPGTVRVAYATSRPWVHRIHPASTTGVDLA